MSVLRQRGEKVQETKAANVEDSNVYGEETSCRGRVVAVGISEDEKDAV